MHKVLIAIGSNHRQPVHIQWAAGRFKTLLNGLRSSRVIWTKDIHGTGKLYMNQLITGKTELSIEELSLQLKEIEAEVHRTKELVTIDLDLMQYDNMRYHLSDWPRPYIQQLLNDIAG